MLPSVTSASSWTEMPDDVGTDPDHRDHGRFQTVPHGSSFHSGLPQSNLIIY